MTLTKMNVEALAVYARKMTIDYTAHGHAGTSTPGRQRQNVFRVLVYENEQKIL